MALSALILLIAAVFALSTDHTRRCGIIVAMATLPFVTFLAEYPNILSEAVGDRVTFGYATIDVVVAAVLIIRPTTVCMVLAALYAASALVNVGAGIVFVTDHDSFFYDNYGSIMFFLNIAQACALTGGTAGRLLDHGADAARHYLDSHPRGRHSRDS